MLGVFGSVPAFDTYFKKGFGVWTFGSKALQSVGEFYQHHATLSSVTVPSRSNFETGKQTHPEVHLCEGDRHDLLSSRSTPPRTSTSLTRTPVSVGADRRRVFQPFGFSEHAVAVGRASRIRGAVRSSCFQVTCDEEVTPLTTITMLAYGLSRARRQDVEVIGPMAFQKLPASRHWRERNSERWFLKHPFPRR